MRWTNGRCSRLSTEWKAIALPILILLGGCDYRPITLRNDTSRSIKAGASSERLSELPYVDQFDPGEQFVGPGIRNATRYLYLSTIRHPEIVAYRTRDLCHADEGRCWLTVSQLEAHRKDLSVPWNQAGIIVPAGGRR